MDGSSGTDLHSSNGANDVFISKYDSDGSYVWTHTVGGGSNDFCGSTIYDSNRNVLLVGAIQGTDVDMDGTEGTDLHSSNGSYDTFVSKYNSDGSYAWTYTLGSTGYDVGYGIVTDSNDNFLILGLFQYVDVDMDATEGVDLHSSNGSLDIFISKYIQDIDAPDISLVHLSSESTTNPTPSIPSLLIT